LKKIIVGFATSVAAAILLNGTLGIAAEKVKIGFVTTLTTGAGAIGQDMQRSANLAIEHLGGKMGPLDIEIIYEDDGFKPEIGKQKTDKLVKKENVDFVAGYIWSHVLLASYKTVVSNDKFLIISNAGHSLIAGKLCNENMFSTSWQNDQTPMAMGELLNRKGIKSLYLMAPNYAAGKNMVSGIERTFKGKVIGKDLTKFPGQLDFSAELAKVRAAKPEALWVFYPGKHGTQFLKQYYQSGLKNTVQLYTTFTVDNLNLPKVGKHTEGIKLTRFWSRDLDAPANKRYVADFKKKYGRYPTYYGAQAYDSIMLINSAVVKVGGNLKDKGRIRAALRAADFESIRGPYSYGQNHMPIQDFYLLEVIKEEGGTYTTKIVETVNKKHQDPYAKECKMSW